MTRRRVCLLCSLYVFYFSFLIEYVGMDAFDVFSLSFFVVYGFIKCLMLCMDEWMTRIIVEVLVFQCDVMHGGYLFCIS